MAESPHDVALESPTISVGDTLRGRLPGTAYQVEEQLGAGGMGAVYRVTQKSSGRCFALKVLHRSHANSDPLRKRFEREAQALEALTHPNIVAITDYGTANDDPYLVMELLEGESLSQRLRRKPLDAGEYRRHGAEMLSAIAYVHSQGLVHRDLKPGNVFLQRLADGSHRAKVLDFGFAKFMGQDHAAKPVDPLTRTGEIFGTPAYMAPEQIGSEATNARTDVYALGTVLFEMAAGRRPFEGDPTDILRGHLVEDPPSLNDAAPGLAASARLEALIARALSKRPEDRFADGGEMLESFVALADPLFGARDATPTRADEKSSRATVPDPVVAAPAGVSRPGVLARSATWAGVVWSRLVTAGAVVLIVLSLAVIIASGVAIYGMRGDTSSARAADARALADKLGDRLARTTDDTKEELRARGVALGRELAKALPALPAEAENENENENAPAIERGDIGSDEPSSELAAIAAETAPDGRRPAARNPWRRPVPSKLRKILKAANAGERGSERAIKTLRSYNREHPEDERGHLLLATLYWNRSWREDALAQYEFAIRTDPTARGANGVLERLIALSSNASTAERAAELIAWAYGREASPAVERALSRPTSDEAERERLVALRDRLAAAP